MTTSVPVTLPGRTTGEQHYEVGDLLRVGETPGRRFGGSMLGDLFGTAVAGPGNGGGSI